MCLSMCHLKKMSTYFLFLSLISTQHVDVEIWVGVPPLSVYGCVIFLMSVISVIVTRINSKDTEQSIIYTVLSRSNKQVPLASIFTLHVNIKSRASVSLSLPLILCIYDNGKSAWILIVFQRSLYNQC